MHVLGNAHEGQEGRSREDGERFQPVMQARQLRRRWEIEGLGMKGMNVVQF